MRSLLPKVLLGAALGLFACGGDGEPAPESGRAICERYRDHIVELRLAGVTSDRDAHRAALHSSLGDEVVATCAMKTTRAELDCGLAAQDLTAFRACSR